MGETYALLQWAHGAEYEALLDLTDARHRAYCQRHELDFIVKRQERMPQSGRAILWRKVELLIEACDAYDHVLYLDADSVICTQDVNLFDASRFGIAACEVWDSPLGMRYLNAGVLFVSRSLEVQQFLTDWLAHPGDSHWYDNAALITLMATRPNRDLLTVLPNRFNWVEHHQEARDPLIRSYHGDRARHKKIRELVA